MKKTISLILLFFSFQQFSFSQDIHFIDSLEHILKSLNATKLELGKYAPTMNDTLTANILYQLSIAYQGNDLDKAMNYARQTLELSEQIGFKKGIGNAYHSMGGTDDNKGDYSSALECYKKSLGIRKDIGDKEGVAGSFNNTGMVYEHIGNYPEALKCYFSSLKLFDELQNKKGQAINYVNIGNIYGNQGNYPEALKYYINSLKIDEEIVDKQGIASVYGNIGLIYYCQGNVLEALRNLKISLNVQKELGDNISIAANSYNNIGNIYFDQGNYQEALTNFFASLKINEKFGDKQSIANDYNNIGKVYTRQKKYKDAAQYLKKSLSLAKEIRSLDNVKDVYGNLATLDSSEGNFMQALEHYKLFITTRDSLINKENTKKMVQTQMQYEFDKKEAATKAAQEKKDALAQKELQKQKLVRNGFIGGFSIVLLFAIVFFMQRMRISKEKKRSEELLLNILPSEVAEELKQKGSAVAKQFDDVTVIFTDFKDFTRISEKLSPVELVAEIDRYFKAFDNIIGKYNIEKIKTIGDSYMAAGGLPVPNKTNPTDVVMAALEIQQFMFEYKQQKKNEGKEIFEIRIGIHTGPVVAGIVGIRKFAYDIWGDTVNIASRMESSGEAGKVNISGSTYALVKDKFTCVHRGKIEAKNKGMFDMYFVER